MTIKLRRGWQKRFADYINKESAGNHASSFTEARAWNTGLKDAVYGLGLAINEDEYRFANGFSKFCKDMGIIDPVEDRARQEEPSGDDNKSTPEE